MNEAKQETIAWSRREELAAEAIRLLIEIASDPNVPVGVRVEACSLILGAAR